MNPNSQLCELINDLLLLSFYFNELYSQGGIKLLCQKKIFIITKQLKDLFYSHDFFFHRENTLTKKPLFPEKEYANNNQFSIFVKH